MMAIQSHATEAFARLTFQADTARPRTFTAYEAAVARLCRDLRDLEREVPPMVERALWRHMKLETK